MENNQEVPFLSVTILNYNYAHYLNKCLDSMLSQTMPEFEIILINDCSKDNSLEIIQPYLSDARIKLVNHTVNKGYVASLVEGCELSIGTYISVISADDYVLENTAFETARTVLLNDPEISLCYSAWNEVDDSEHIRHTRRAADHDYVDNGLNEFKRLILSSPILHSGTIIRRDAYHSVGGYDSRCRYSVDTNLWLAICSVGKVAYINRPLYAYRAHDSNMSNTSGALWQATEEMLLGIDVALNRFPDEVLPDKTALRRKAQKRALVAVPTLDIFANRFKRGWYGFWKAFQHYPVLTLGQPRVISLTLRTLLGPQNYEYVVRLRACLKMGEGYLQIR